MKSIEDIPMENLNESIQASLVNNEKLKGNLV